MPKELVNQISFEEIALLCRSNSSTKIQELLLRIGESLAEMQDRINAGEKLLPRERVIRSVLRDAVKRLEHRIKILENQREKQKEQRLKIKIDYEQALQKAREELELQELRSYIKKEKTLELRGKLILADKNKNSTEEQTKIKKLSLEELEAIDPDAALIAKKIQANRTEKTQQTQDQDFSKIFELEGDVL